MSCDALHEGCDVKMKLYFLLKMPLSCLLGLQEFEDLVFKPGGDGLQRHLFW